MNDRPTITDLAVGQLVRDRTRSTFKVAIVIGTSNRPGRLRVCRWMHNYSRWSCPAVVAADMLEVIGGDYDLTTRHGLQVAAARRDVKWNGGKVKWPIGGGFHELAYVERTRP